MPMNKALYPANWPAISKAIRERANHHCEECGVSNQALILRSTVDPSRFIVYDADRDCHYLDGAPVRLSEIPDEFEGDHYVRIVLTVAHLDHNPANNDYANLKALCQRCHLRLDGHEHAQHAKVTRGAKRRAEIAASGQLSLIDD